MALTCRLTPPPNFPQLDPADPGPYIFGYPDFRVQPIRVANVLHRSFAGPHEDFILGVLSVILIAMLTEIVQVILMRTSRQRVTRRGLYAAFVLDEVTHFRNVFSHLRGRSRSKVPRSAMWFSLMVLGIATVLIAAEVFAVYLTQPHKVYASSEKYNLRGVQPVWTAERAAVEVNKLTEKKRCVSPMMPGSNQSREFAISACVNRAIDNAMDDIDATATFVKLTSWFHEAGSNHHITYGNEETGETGTHEISTRASVMQSELGINNGIMFEVDPLTLPEFTRFLHWKAIEAAISKSCDFFDTNCEKALSDCEARPNSSPWKDITLWERNNGTGLGEPVVVTMKGITTRYNVTIRAPNMALRESFRVFATSAAIEEVLNGHGLYVSMPEGEELYTMEALVSEEGRIAGVVLLGIITIVTLAVLIILRLCLKPATLSRIATEAFEEEETYYEDEEDLFTPEPYTADHSVWSMSRDIVDPDLDDFDSTDKFELPLHSRPRRFCWRPHDRGRR